MKFTGSELIAHKEILFGYARKRVRNDDDALDIVQTTYMKAIRSSETWNGENLKAWLFAILKNVMKDYYEKLPKQLTDDTPFEEQNESELPPVIDEYQLGKIFKDEELEAAFQELSTYQKDVIYKTYFLDIDNLEEADKLGIPKQTLISRRKKGMDSLRRKLKAV